MIASESPSTSVHDGATSPGVAWSTVSVRSRHFGRSFTGCTASETVATSESSVPSLARNVRLSGPL